MGTISKATYDAIIANLSNYDPPTLILAKQALAAYIVDAGKVGIDLHKVDSITRDITTNKSYIPELQVLEEIQLVSGSRQTYNISSEALYSFRNYLHEFGFLQTSSSSSSTNTCRRKIPNSVRKFTVPKFSR